MKKKNSKKRESDAVGSRRRRASGARTNLAYWKQALRRLPKTGNYSVLISCGRRPFKMLKVPSRSDLEKNPRLDPKSDFVEHEVSRFRFTFGTNLEAAAERARKIFLCVEREGWERAIEKFKPELAERERERRAELARAGRIGEPTVGDVIRVAREFAAVRPATFQGYVTAFRFLVSEVCGIYPMLPVGDAGRGGEGAAEGKRSGKDMRRDISGGGMAAWREAVESVKLSDVTSSGVRRWKKEYLERAGTDPAKEGSAKVSFNRVLRNAKSLFSRKLMRELRERMLIDEGSLFFQGVEREKEPPMRYRSRMDPGAILKAGGKELAGDRPELFKALVLCLVLGLRRSEADALLWDSVDFERGEVVVESTKYNKLKSADSERVLALDEGSLALLRGWRARAGGVFVIESGGTCNPNTLSRSYRCAGVFKELVGWLKGKGVEAQKPIHELRKEAGTLLLKQGAPIESVSRYLGHATIGITLAHYADLTKQRATVDLGELMPAEAVEFPGGGGAFKAHRKDVGGKRAGNE